MRNAAIIAEAGDAAPANETSRAISLTFGAEEKLQLLKKMVQMSQWYRLHGCYRRRLCKKADNPDDGVVNVADNVIDVDVDADVADVVSGAQTYR